MPSFLHCRFLAWVFLVVLTTMYLSRHLAVLDTFSKKTPSDLIVPTELGPVLGQLHPKYLTRSFLGIPYADPPIGPRRFSSPQPYSTPWGEVDPITNVSRGIPRPSIHPPPACPQYGVEFSREDCLYLNIHTPPTSSKTSSPLPVLVWIHGGAFYVGSGYQDGYYDGNRLAKHANVIVISLNYRLGVLGFFRAKSEKGISNAGLADQRMALEWIKRNIRYFGGDPGKITLWGESAGATSVLAHLSSPSFPRDLVAGVIAQSPPLGAYIRTESEALEVGATFAKNVSCLIEQNGSISSEDQVDLECLRALSLSRLMLAQRYTETGGTDHHPLGDVYWWWPSEDGDLVREPLQTLASGKAHPIPLILGVNRDETGLFALRYDLPIASSLLGLRKRFNEDAYRREIIRIFGKASSKVLSTYPSNPDRTENERTIVDLTTDYLFRCPILKAAKGHQYAAGPGKDGTSQSWVYQFTQIPSYAGFVGKCGDEYVCHALELPYLWRPAVPILLPEEMHLSKRMIKHWSHFALESEAAWQGYWGRSKAESGLGGWLELGDRIRVHTDHGPHGDHCHLWNDDLGYQW